MFQYAHLAGRLYGRPLLVTPDRAAQLVAYLSMRQGISGTINLAGVETSLSDIQARSAEMYAQRQGGPERKYYQVHNRIALIPIKGTLVHECGIEPWSGMVGYDGIRFKLDEALYDDDVDGIMLLIDSPGGECAGLQEIVDHIYAMRSIKPIWAHGDVDVYSAAYAVASQADRLLVTTSGGAGSIGVVVMHSDYSAAMGKEGVKVTFIHAGAHKVDGNAYQALPDDVRAKIQSNVDEVYQEFISNVCRGRPGLTPEAVKATEADCFNAKRAEALGLIDGVMPLDAAIAAFSEELAGQAPAANQTGENMSKLVRPTGSTGSAPRPAATAGTANADGVDAENAGGAAAEDDTPETEDDEKPTPAKEKDKKAESDDGDDDADGDDNEGVAKAAAAAERNRINAIIELPEAEGREATASHLALKTAMSPAEAAGILAVTPKDAAASVQNSLDMAMANFQNPDVGASAPAVDAESAAWAAAVKNVTGLEG